MRQMAWISTVPTLLALSLLAAVSGCDRGTRLLANIIYCFLESLPSPGHAEDRRNGERLESRLSPDALGITEESQFFQFFVG